MSLHAGDYCRLNSCLVEFAEHLDTANNAALVQISREAKALLSELTVKYGRPKPYYIASANRGLSHYGRGQSDPVWPILVQTLAYREYLADYHAARRAKPTATIGQI